MNKKKTYEEIGKLMVHHTIARREVEMLKLERNLINQCGASGDEIPCFIEFRNNDITEDELCVACVERIKLTKPMIESSYIGRGFKIKATHLINEVLKSK